MCELQHSTHVRSSSRGRCRSSSAYSTQSIAATSASPVAIMRTLVSCDPLKTTEEENFLYVVPRQASKKHDEPVRPSKCCVEPLRRAQLSCSILFNRKCDETADRR